MGHLPLGNTAAAGLFPPFLEGSQLFTIAAAAGEELPFPFPFQLHFLMTVRTPGIRAARQGLAIATGTILADQHLPMPPLDLKQQPAAFRTFLPREIIVMEYCCRILDLLHQQPGMLLDAPDEILRCQLACRNGGKLPLPAGSKLRRTQLGWNQRQKLAAFGRSIKLTAFFLDVKGRKQLSCYLTRTTQNIHNIILSNLDKAPMYNGSIDSTGPRYCPSIEDKVVKFSEKDSHHLFLEPEGFDTSEVYISGLSTSFPAEIQQKIVNNVIGLENAHIMRYGYAVEYDYVDPSGLKYTLESRVIENLYLAGQINGTSGYEEAAAQ